MSREENQGREAETHNRCALSHPLGLQANRAQSAGLRGEAKRPGVSKDRSIPLHVIWVNYNISPTSNKVIAGLRPTQTTIWGEVV